MSFDARGFAREAEEQMRNGQPNGEAQFDPHEWRTRLNLRCAADLEGKAIKPREWLVAQWIPLGHLTGLYGRGGFGKTTIATQLCCAASVAHGHWLGMPVRQSRPFGFFAEDDEDEIERKIYDISQAYNQRRADYGAFKYLARFGEDNLLFVRGRVGLETTNLFADLCQLVADEQRNLLVFDGIPDIYGLSINDQAEVTWAMGKLLWMAKPTRGTILLLGHPNKAGTSEFTGCAAWENKPRARLYVGTPKQNGNDGEPDINDPRRTLSRSKANLSGKDTMEIVWRDGVFRSADPADMTMSDKCAARERDVAAQDAFLTALDILTQQQRHTSHLDNARNYAPRLITKFDLGGGFTASSLERAMLTLLDEGRIRPGATLPWRDSSRRPVSGLARG